MNPDRIKNGVYTDHHGNTWRLELTLRATDFDFIAYRFKKLFGRVYGCAGDVFAVASSRDLDGTWTHDFSGVFSGGPIVVITDAGTQFWRPFGPWRSIFDEMRDNEERIALTKNLLGHLSLDELRRAYVVVKQRKKA